MIEWDIRCRGGAFDGYTGTTVTYPQPVLILWVCGPLCGGHGTFNVSEPAIRLRTAEAYTRAEVDEQAHLAVYEVGEHEPAVDVEERELVPVGVGGTSG